MHNPNLGVVPFVAIAAKAIPAAISLLSGKKKKKAAERMAQYQANEQEILAGRAVMATDVMTESDMDFLRQVWPRVHVAARFEDINWPATGYPKGPPLTPAALAAVKHVWPAVHVANNFSDVSWQYHAVPNELVAKLLPLPELGYQQPLPSSGTVPGYSQNVGRQIGPVQAGLFPGISTETVIVAAVIGAGALLLFGDRR